MSDRTLIARWGCVARGTGRPYRLWIFRDQQGVVHRSETTKDIVNIDDVPEQPLDHRRYQPAWLPGWTKWQGDPNGVWIKQIVYEEPLERSHISFIATMREICVLEVLRLHPHPNVCPYLGCDVSPSDQHVQGLVFERMDLPLDRVMSRINFDRAVGNDERPHPPLDHVVQDIRKATAHLQSLGFLYMDIKPANIMWKATAEDASAGRWCLIDFSECYAPGTTFTHGVPGTPGWTDDDARVVTDDLLESMLLKLALYIETGLEPSTSGDAINQLQVNFNRNVAKAIAAKVAKGGLKAKTEANTADASITYITNR